MKQKPFEVCETVKNGRRVKTPRIIGCKLAYDGRPNANGECEMLAIDECGENITDKMDHVISFCFSGDGIFIRGVKNFCEKGGIVKRYYEWFARYFDVEENK